MSQNAAVVRLLYEAWNRGDVDAVLEQCTEDFELRTAGIHPGLGARYEGHDEFRRFWQQFVGTWERLTVELDEMVERGEFVLSLFRFHGVGRDGIELSRPFAHLLELRDGRIVRARGYADQAEGRRDFDAVAATAR